MSWLRSRWFKAIQVVATVATFYFVVRNISRDWDKVRESGVTLVFKPGWILLSLGIVWVMWAGLIEGWRRIAAGWGARLYWPTAGRIWMLASFAKYIPGKVYTIACMVALSESAGVSGKFTVGSAVVMQVLNVGTGVAVAAMMLGASANDHYPYAGPVMILLGLITLGTLVAFGTRSVSGRLWRLARVEEPTPPPPSVALLGTAILINVVTWLAYGLALVWLANGILPGVTLGWREATGAFTFSYLVGFLGPAPGGLGARDGILVVMLAQWMGYGEALALAAASRLAFTFNELGAAAPFFFTRESTRDHT